MIVWNCVKKLLFNKNIPNVLKYSTEAKESLIYVGFQKINYLKIGNGPKNIVCFPGALGTIWTNFKLQIEGLNKDDFTIFIWEPPGHGKSRPPERVYNSKFFHEDADMGYKFAKAVGLKSFSLFGWSNGGTTGLILAAKYPEIVEKLIVCGAISYLTKEDYERYTKILQLDSFHHVMKATLLELYGEKTLREVHNGLLEANKGILAEGGEISSSLVKNIKCPTLIIHGAKDPIVAFRHPNYLFKNIKQARLHIFPEGAHNLHMRFAEEFNEIATKFLLE